MGTQKRVEQIDFHIEHLAIMDMREEELQGIMSLDDAFDRFELMRQASIGAHTFLYDGRIIFCAGYHEMWPGVIDCWMVPSIYVKTMTIEFCRILRGYVGDIIAEEKCHRFQTSAPDDELHARWMRFLGMKREGLMKNFTHNKQDYVMYARTT